MKKEISVGDLVAFNTLDDATVFRVVDRKGRFTVEVVEAGRHYTPQAVDSSLCKPATGEQCRNHLKDLP
jgi:hypothetical protein